ncbi:hypothetical protein MFIFM68171_06660 [Madurella fahalii]|uniref:Uncharacterized protein n=1 Tax=Madurella fahalii TaxID=1157608 RepID=A0ABQ0GFH7_9PEZI
MPALVTVEDSGPSSDGQASPETHSAERRISETTTAVDNSSAVAKPLKLKKHPIGFTVLYQPTDPNDAIADVIFVHGLAGGAISTWTCENPRTLSQKLQPCTHPATETCWPRDILPEEQPDVRVVTYGYSAPVGNNPFFSTKVIKSDLNSDAQTFLHQLILFRSKTKSEYRPLIFIGHSLGGLVIERALARCSILDDTHPDEQRIFACTKAVAAIGVPHTGSAIATRVLRIAWLIWPFLGLNTGVLRTLQVQTHVAFDWKGDYKVALRKRYEQGDPILLTFVAEKFGFTYVGKVVNQASAVLTQEYQAQSSEVEGNHLTMVKFWTKDDPRFLAIWQPLSRLIQGIKDGTVWIFRNEDKDYNWDLFPSEVMTPKSKFVGRVDLLQRLDALVKSKEERSGKGKNDPHVVALVGVGGVGKSQLALQYAKIHNARSEFINVFLFDSSSAPALESGIRAACKKLRKDRKWIDPTWTPSEALEDSSKAVFVRDYFRETKRKWLVILDNYDAADEFDIRDAMPKGPAGCVIITSRITDPDPLGYPTILEVPPMDEKDALELLYDRLFRKPTKRYKYQCPWVKEDAKKLVDRLGYLPLAIEMAAAFITHSHARTTLATFVDKFNREEKKIYQQTLYSLVYRRVANQTGRQVSLSIMATFDLQIHHLKEREKGKAWKYLEIAGFVDRNRLDASFFDRTQTALSYPNNDEWVSRSVEADSINEAFDDLAKNSLATLVSVEEAAKDVSELVKEKAAQAPVKEEATHVSVKGPATQVPVEKSQPPVPQLRLHTAISEWIRMRQVTIEEGQNVFRKAARMINFHLRRCDHDDVMSCNYGLTSAIVQHIFALMRNDNDFNTPTASSPVSPANRLGSGNLLAATIRFAGFMQDMGHPDAAETLYNTVITRTEPSTLPEDPTNLHLTDAKEGLAIVKLWKGELEAAERLCKTCMDKNEDHKLRGENHRTTLRTYHNLGEILCASKKFPEAIDMFRKALDAAILHDQEDGLGAVANDGKKLEWSEDSLREQEALGNAYRCNGQLEDAFEKVNEALTYLNAKKRESDLCYSTHESMALVLKAQGKFERSRYHYNIAIEGYKKTVGEYQHGTLGAMEGLADAMRRDGMFSDAKDLLERVLDRRRLVNGPDSNHFKRVVRALELVPKDGVVYRGRFDELEEYSFPWPRPVYAADDPAEDAADKVDDWT